MKYFLLMLLIPHCLYSQDKIEGIGKFKINKTSTQIIEDVSSELKCKVKPIVSFMEYYEVLQDRPKVFKITSKLEDPKAGAPHAPECAGVEVYFLNTYTIADIEIKEIFLTFKDGILIKLNCNSNSDFKDALNLKYGEPKLSTVTKTVTCTYKLTGNKVDYEENTYTGKWTNEDIVATSTFGVYYNDKCEKRYIDVFYIENASVSRDISNCESAGRQYQKDLKDKESKKKLSDF